MFLYTNADELDGLFHVGTLDIAKKSNFSHEWNGLSVSNCPDAWKIICGCNGVTWQLIPQHQDVLLLFHELDENDFNVIFNWAIDAGYFISSKEYRVSWFDDEYEDNRWFTFSADEYDDAVKEYKAMLEDEREQVEFIEIENGLAPTSTLENMSLVNMDAAMYRDIAVLLYAESVLGCDGVWWDDIYDPYGLSAPRGVIFNSAISNFKAIDSEQN